MFHRTPEKRRDLLGIDQRGRAERGGGLGHGDTLEGLAVSYSPRKALLGPPVLFMGTIPARMSMGPQKKFFLGPGAGCGGAFVGFPTGPGKREQGANFMGVGRPQSGPLGSHGAVSAGNPALAAEARVAGDRAGSGGLVVDRLDVLLGDLPVALFSLHMDHREDGVSAP